MTTPTQHHRRPDRPRCPVRPQDFCSLCFPGADGPENCGLVYLARNDPELMEAWANRDRPDTRRDADPSGRVGP